MVMAPNEYATMPASDDPNSRSTILGTYGYLLTQYTYDNFNRNTRVDLPRPSSGATAYNTQSKYDAQGRKWLAIDADGKATGYFYDGLGRLIWVVNGANPANTLPSPLYTTQSGWGRVANNVDATVTQYTYDDLEIWHRR